MKWLLLVALALVAVLSVPTTEAFRYGGGWGRGGWGGGWGRGYGGWGRGWGYGGYRGYGGYGGYYGGYGGYYPYYSAYSYYPYRYYRGVEGAAAVNTPKIVTCNWIEKDAMFSCKTPNGLIECPVVANFTAILPHNFDYFGIGWIKSFDYARVLDATRYELAVFPRSALPDDTTGKWFNRTFPVGDKFTDLTFFNTFDIAKFGFRIADTECFKNLITAFQTVTDKLNIKLDNELKTEIPLFAEIIKV